MGNCISYTDADVNTQDAPESFDWRDKNAVTDVKDKASCGSCWAFSAIGNVEGQHAIKHEELVQLSEQQLVDCDEQSSGCGGGYISTALSKLAENGGSETSADYPYISVTDHCKFDPTKIHAKVTGCKAYSLKDQDKLKELLYKTGPLSVDDGQHHSLNIPQSYWDHQSINRHGDYSKTLHFEVPYTAVNCGQALNVLCWVLEAFWVCHNGFILYKEVSAFIQSNAEME